MEKNDIVYICSPLSAPTKEGIRQKRKGSFPVLRRLWHAAD